MSKITANEKSFCHLNPANKRIALAQDVLLRMDQGKWRPLRGLYVRVSNMFLKNTDKQKSLQDLLSEINCECCAKGGLLLALIDKSNQFQVGQLTQCCGSRSDSAYYLHRDDIIKQKLEGIFSHNCLDLIESAFESDHLVGLTVDRGLLIEAKNMYPKSWSAPQRMRAIMNNIISNKGSFVLPSGHSSS